MPWDYPPEWNDYYFNENFVLAAYLLGAGSVLEYVLPCFYVNNIDLDVRKAMAEIWDLPVFKAGMGELSGGGAFWFRKKGPCGISAPLTVSPPASGISVTVGRQVRKIRRMSNRAVGFVRMIYRLPYRVAYASYKTLRRKAVAALRNRLRG